ncbi:c-type cytochrome [Hydrogenophaga sp.]|uniref:c-type cytochrome n=1 Tax=Hydrogenophaga sp. TaxID=1904254 RepID=UPI0025C351CC|nr:c-type cytochrome [Hydrogenophaga sp.]
MRLAALLLALGAPLLSVGACKGPRAGPGGAGWPVAEEPGDARRGQVLAAAYGCGACHRIEGAPWARGRVGPPLDGVGRRAYLGGVLPNTPAGMVAWLRSPQRADPGTAMPDLGLSEAEARDIAAYMHTL